MAVAIQSLLLLGVALLVSGPSLVSAQFCWKTYSACPVYKEESGSSVWYYDGSLYHAEASWGPYKASYSGSWSDYWGYWWSPPKETPSDYSCKPSDEDGKYLEEPYKETEWKSKKYVVLPCGEYEYKGKKVKYCVEKKYSTRNGYHSRYVKGCEQEEEGGSRKLMSVAAESTVSVDNTVAAVAQSTDDVPSHSRKMLNGYWWGGWYDNGYHNGYDNNYDNHHGGWYRNGGKCEDKTKKYGGWCKNKKGCKICTCNWWYYSYTWKGTCDKWAQWY